MIMASKTTITRIIMSDTKMSTDSTHKIVKHHIK